MTRRKYDTVQVAVHLINMIGVGTSLVPSSGYSYPRFSRVTHRNSLLCI